MSQRSIYQHSILKQRFTLFGFLEGCFQVQNTFTYNIDKAGLETRSYTQIGDGFKHSTTHRYTPAHTMGT